MLPRRRAGAEPDVEQALVPPGRRRGAGRRAPLRARRRDGAEHPGEHRQVASEAVHALQTSDRTAVVAANVAEVSAALSELRAQRDSQVCGLSDQMGRVPGLPHAVAERAAGLEGGPRPLVADPLELGLPDEHHDPGLRPRRAPARPLMRAAHPGDTRCRCAMQTALLRPTGSLRCFISRGPHEPRSPVVSHCACREMSAMRARVRPHQRGAPHEPYGCEAIGTQRSRARHGRTRAPAARARPDCTYLAAPRAFARP
mmetsp:Transcript_18824/g.53590  ORF Transcript_18824/g.53590 Transcript_18824/m.53590 type:complete len:257 (-) Transcript_18824:36-806(-)